MKTNNTLVMAGMGLVSLLVVGCASSTDESTSEGDAPVPVLAPTEEGVSIKSEDEECHRSYSEVVPAYVDYASVHCEGWSGKVFCEYDSLSSTYGPGWGTCQCYMDICEKRGRSCRSWWGC